MNYTPRYSQPFTLAKAASFDIPVITEEITRLQNSLQHLRQTQDTLREYIESEDAASADSEVTKAFEENKDVIGSQEERISMLKIILVEKGVRAGSHYDVASEKPHEPAQNGTTRQIRITGTPIVDNEPTTEDDGGIHL